VIAKGETIDVKMDEKEGNVKLDELDQI